MSGRIKTFSNGGTVLPSDLDSIEDDYECAFGTYKTVMYVGGVEFETGYTTALATCAPSFTSAFYAGTNGMWGLLYLDPALWWSDASTHTVNPRTVYYSILSWGSVNNQISNTNYTVGLYPVTGTGTDNQGGPPTFGTVVSGSTLTFNNPAAGSLFQAKTADFAAPAAGYYAVAVQPSATVGGSGTVVTIAARLLVRQV